MNRSPAHDIRPRDLATFVQKRQERRVQTFEQVVQKALAKLYKSAELGHTSCMYEVPVFIPGLPAYDANLATAFVVLRLRKLEYQVQCLGPRMLWVSWDHVRKDATPKVLSALEAHRERLLLPPAPAAPSSRPPAPPVAVSSSDSAMRELRKVYDDASLRILERLAPTTGSKAA